MDMLLLSGQWLSTDDLAEILRIDSSTLRHWRTMTPPQGPPFVKISERVTVYHSGDIETWLTSRRTDPNEVAE
ncbi:helix-turn-helix domain-containing protein [Saccharopolyspora sp. NPDC049426]|uniref:helix-turn-helix transcriptional regulator n=1 Tax=Saccharopolyspora sp. NPDC049426 TaxID=3155652 RepID=UPI00343E9863